MFETSKYIELKDGFNVYEIRVRQGGLALLKCVVFSETEDVGDGILFNDSSPAQWVALSYFGHKFQSADYRML
jgi:hypothetical protein